MVVGNSVESCILGGVPVSTVGARPGREVDTRLRSAAPMSARVQVTLREPSTEVPRLPMVNVRGVFHADAVEALPTTSAYIVEITKLVALRS